MKHENQSHGAAYIGAALAGLATGLAAGLFLKSKKGEEFTNATKQTAMRLQKQLVKKLEGMKEVTQEKYEELVESIVDHYRETKDLAEDELGKLKSYLLDQWDDMKAQSKDGKD